MLLKNDDWRAVGHEEVVQAQETAATSSTYLLYFFGV